MKKFFFILAAVIAAGSIIPAAATDLFAATKDPKLIILGSTKQCRAEEYMDRGNLCSERMDYANALEAYDKVLADFPGLTAAHYNRALALAGLGRYEDALDEYEKCIILDGGNAARYYNNKGNALGRLGRAEEALEAFNKAIELDPGYASAYYNKSIALADLGLKKDAERALKRALDLDPELKRFIE